MVNELMLLTGIDVPYVSAAMTVHQPTIKEISFIGENDFWVGCELFRFSKDKLPEQDKIKLKNFSDFDIIMSMLKEQKTPEAKENTKRSLMVLQLMFPAYQITLMDEGIQLTKNEQNYTINKDNFSEFKSIFLSIFGLKEKEEAEYKPVGKLSNSIAEKLRKGKAKVAALKSGNANGEKRIYYLARYASILSIGLHISINDIMNYTVFQLFDSFARFELKINFDFTMSAKLAGAQNMKEAENWMKDIYLKK